MSDVIFQTIKYLGSHMPLEKTLEESIKIREFLYKIAEIEMQDYFKKS